MTVEQVTREQWEQVRASLPRAPQRPAPKAKPAPKPGATDWMPDSWKVIGLLVLVFWPVALMHGSVWGWILEGCYLLFLPLLILGSKYSRRR